MAKLQTYRGKRDFTRTSEPKGRPGRPAAPGFGYVVQKHAARRLHYDFRLELDGVLKSWAVAKGPSLVPGDKRLAVHVEDHPLDYGSFEGTIPEGEYGGGTVLLWDRGRWEPDGDPHKGYADGHLRFRLYGEKLKGGWHLVRMGRKPKERQESWLLIKADDGFSREEGAADVLEERPLSVASGRDLDAIARAAGAPAPSGGPAAAGAKRRSKTAGKREDAGAQTAAPRRTAPGTRAKAAGSRKRPARTAARPAPEAEVAGVRLTHPERVLWDEQGLTKQGLAEFYVAIEPWILPHVAHRPLSLVRCPSGSQKGCFFQKHSWAGLDAHILRAAVKSQGGAEEEVLLVRDIAGIVALVQAGVLEIHPWGAPIADVEHPDRITFDFDPGADVPWTGIIEAARELRERLAAAGLESFAKTTGGKGLHVVVPIEPRADWVAVKAFAREVATAMARDSPERYLIKASKSERQGRIFIDYLRNGRGATAIAAYSTRARAGAPVSTPLAWDELSADVPSNHFTVANLTARLAGLAKDPWADLRSLKQRLPRTPAKAKKGRGPG